MAALDAGASVIANDLEPKHLDILSSKASPEKRTRLTLMPGSIRDCLSVRREPIGAALCSRILHFLDIEELKKTIAALYAVLVPGGRLFLVDDSPFLGNSQSFIPEYRRRCLKLRKWPGYVDDVREYREAHNDMCPPVFHFFDVASLSRVCRNAGFDIVEASLFARPEYPTEVQLRGCEGVGAIAEKPWL